MDFFPNKNSLQHSTHDINQVLQNIYDIEKVNQNIWVGCNLQWPKFDLPVDRVAYFISWHTEQMDVHWVKRQALRVYPSPVLVASDTTISVNDFWPDNIEFIRFITWHKQLAVLVNLYGIVKQPKRPEYKISSLSFRVSQYKRFATAYVLDNFDPKDIILTYHGHLGKEEDNHGHPMNLPWLDNLKKFACPVFVNFNDGYDIKQNAPVANGDWRTLCYEKALFNLTNESFHYSKSEIDDKEFIFPSPYLTEKTWKPLLAGRPFVSVAQSGVYQNLANFGLKFDYGIDLSYDADDGDLTRIKGIFKTLDRINAMDLDVLYEMSIESCQHNILLIESCELADRCIQHNIQSLDRIQEFLR